MLGAMHCLNVILVLLKFRMFEISSHPSHPKSVPRWGLDRWVSHLVPMVAPYLVLLQNYLILVIPYGGFLAMLMLCSCETTWWNIWGAMWMKWDAIMKPGNIHVWFDIWILFWWMIGEKVQLKMHWNMLGATSLAIIRYWTSVIFLSPSPCDASKSLDLLNAAAMMARQWARSGGSVTQRTQWTRPGQPVADLKNPRWVERKHTWPAWSSKALWR